jgi:hypothetical protein
MSVHEHSLPFYDHSFYTKGTFMDVCDCSWDGVQWMLMNVLFTRNERSQTPANDHEHSWTFIKKILSCEKNDHIRNVYGKKKFMKVHKCSLMFTILWRTFFFSWKELPRKQLSNIHSTFIKSAIVYWTKLWKISIVWDFCECALLWVIQRHNKGYKGHN